MSDANIFKLPTTFKHNHHDHDCSCVKCYVDKLTIIPKVEFVWLIDYFFVDVQLSMFDFLALFLIVISIFVAATKPFNKNYG